MRAHAVARTVGRLGRTGWARWVLREAQVVGARPRVLGTPWVENAGRLEVGDDFTLSSDPVTSHVVVARGALLRIGHRVSIGNGAAIAVAQRVVLGDEVTLAPLVMVMDCDFHDADSGQDVTRSKPVVLGEGVHVGHGAVVLRGTQLGAGVRVAPGSVVSGVVPAGTHVGGVPARPLREEGGAPLDRASPLELAEQVCQVVATLFQVRRRVQLQDGPDTIPGWDSMGALRLLVALEDDLRVPVDAARMARARSVGEVVEALS